MNIFYYLIISSLFTFFMTVIGALAVYIFKSTKDIIMDSLLGLSSGIMLSSAIFSLLLPAIEEARINNMNIVLVINVGLLLGALFILITSKIAVKKYDSKIKNAIILVISIIMHNIPEGASIGIAFGAASTGNYLNAAISLAIGIGIQNIPEGAAISMPLVRNGVSKNKAFLLGVFSGIVEIPSLFLGYFFASKLDNILPYFLSFAAGTMLYVIISELIPESINEKNKDIVSFITIIGFILMIILELCI